MCDVATRRVEIPPRNMNTFFLGDETALSRKKGRTSTKVGSLTEKDLI